MKRGDWSRASIQRDRERESKIWAERARVQGERAELTIAHYKELVDGGTDPKEAEVLTLLWKLKQGWDLR